MGRIADAVLGEATPSILKTAPRIVSDPATVKAGAEAAFKEASDQGAIWNIQGIKKLSQDIVGDLRKGSFHPGNEPGVTPVLEELNRMARTGNVTLEGLHALRRLAQNGYRPGMGSNNARIGEIVARIDDLVTSARPGSSLMAASGDAALAGSALKKGIGEWHKFRKLDTIESLAGRGEAMGSMLKSQDIASAKTRHVARIFTNDRIGRGFSRAEREAARDVAKKSVAAQAADAVQGLIPYQGRLQGMASGMQLIHNIVSGNIVGIGLQAGGALAGIAGKKITERSADAAIQRFAELVANGGVPYKYTTNALKGLTAAQRKTFQRALARAGIAGSTLVPMASLQSEAQ